MNRNTGNKYTKIVEWHLFREKEIRQAVMEARLDGASSGNSSGLNVGSDTPQGQISKASILAGDYATGTSASEGEATNNSEENYTKRVKGNSGVSATAQKMVEQFRDNIRAIDFEIIQELEDLFMIIY